MGRFPSCSICMEVFRDFTGIAASSCGHTFHHRCLMDWVDKCESRRQPPACPTCMKRFDNEPSVGVIEKLYFSLDGNAVPPQFDDEYLAEQMDLNEKLAGDVASRDIEIKRLQAQLKTAEADQKRLQEETNKAHKTCKAALVEWKRVSEALKEAEICKEKAEASLKAERVIVKHVKAHLESVNGEKSALKNQVTALNKLVDVKFTGASQGASASQHRDRYEGQSSSCDEMDNCYSRHVVICNLDERVTSNAIRDRLSKWDPEYVGIRFNSSLTRIESNVVLQSTDDAKAVIDRLDRVPWYGKELQVCYATAEQETNLLSRRCFISNIQYGASNRKIEVLFSEFGRMKSAEILRDGSGRSLGAAVVVFQQRKDAERARTKYNGVPLDDLPMAIQLITQLFDGIELHN